MALQIGDPAPDFDLVNANASVGEVQMQLGNSRRENGLIVVF